MSSPPLFHARRNERKRNGTSSSHGQESARKKSKTGTEPVLFTTFLDTRESVVEPQDHVIRERIWASGAQDAKRDILSASQLSSNREYWANPSNWTFSTAALVGLAAYNSRPTINDHTNMTRSLAEPGYDNGPMYETKINVEIDTKTKKQQEIKKQNDTQDGRYPQGVFYNQFPSKKAVNCATCRTTTHTMLVCSVCRAEYYCSDACLQKDSIHFETICMPDRVYMAVDRNDPDAVTSALDKLSSRNMHDAILALQLACSRQKVQLVKLIVQHKNGVDLALRLPDYHGKTIFHWFIDMRYESFSGHLEWINTEEVYQYLLKWIPRCDVAKHLQVVGDVPLFTAARRGWIGMIKDLYREGANFFAVTYCGQQTMSTAHHQSTDVANKRMRLPVDLFQAYAKQTANARNLGEEETRCRNLLWLLGKATRIVKETFQSNQSCPWPLLQHVLHPYLAERDLGNFQELTKQLFDQIKDILADARLHCLENPSKWSNISKASFIAPDSKLERDAKLQMNHERKKASKRHSDGLRLLSWACCKQTRSEILVILATSGLVVLDEFPTVPVEDDHDHDDDESDSKMIDDILTRLDKEPSPYPPRQMTPLRISQMWRNLQPHHQAQRNFRPHVPFSTASNTADLPYYPVPDRRVWSPPADHALNVVKPNSFHGDSATQMYSTDTKDIKDDKDVKDDKNSAQYRSFPEPMYNCVTKLWNAEDEVEHAARTAIGFYNEEKTALVAARLAELAAGYSAVTQAVPNVNHVGQANTIHNKAHPDMASPTRETVPTLGDYTPTPNEYTTNGINLEQFLSASDIFDEQPVTTTLTPLFKPQIDEAKVEEEDDEEINVGDLLFRYDRNEQPVAKDASICKYRPTEDRLLRTTLVPVGTEPWTGAPRYRHTVGNYMLCGPVEVILLSMCGFKPQEANLIPEQWSWKWIPGDETALKLLELLASCGAVVGPLASVKLLASNGSHWLVQGKMTKSNTRGWQAVRTWNTGHDKFAANVEQLLFGCGIIKNVQGIITSYDERWQTAAAFTNALIINDNEEMKWREAQKLEQALVRAVALASQLRFILGRERILAWLSTRGIDTLEQLMDKYKDCDSGTIQQAVFAEFHHCPRCKIQPQPSYIGHYNTKKARREDLNNRQCLERCPECDKYCPFSAGFRRGAVDVECQYTGQDNTFAEYSCNYCKATGRLRCPSCGKKSMCSIRVLYGRYLECENSGCRTRFTREHSYHSHFTRSYKLLGEAAQHVGVNMPPDLMFEHRADPYAPFEHKVDSDSTSEHKSGSDSTSKHKGDSDSTSKHKNVPTALIQNAEIQELDKGGFSNALVDSDDDEIHVPTLVSADDDDVEDAAVETEDENENETD